MARAGIYKSDVVRARARLISQDRYPSIDSVREELGNTGSKATIHRYLKEIEEEEGAASGSKIAISEALQGLVARISATLKDEADAKIAEAEAKFRAESEVNDKAVAGLKEELEATRSEISKFETRLAREVSAHEMATSKMHETAQEAARLAQQVADLTDRLAAEEKNRQSAEAEGKRAWDTLDHFREAARQQLEQEQRQHEHQVEFLQGEVRTHKQIFLEKVDEANRGIQQIKALEQSQARMAQDLVVAKAELDRLGRVREDLAVANRMLEESSSKNRDQQANIAALEGEKAVLQEKLALAVQATHIKETELAAARSAAQTSEKITEQIRTMVADLSQAMATERDLETADPGNVVVAKSQAPNPKKQVKKS